MRDIAISGMLIFILSILALELVSLVAAFIGAGMSVYPVWSWKGKDSLLQFRNRPRAMYLDILFSIMLFALFSANPLLLVGFIWGYVVGAALTYGALTGANNP